MNRVILLGRLTKEVDVRYAGETCVARYGLAVDRKYKKEGEPSADFINCVAFGNQGQFAEKYLRKGMKIAIVGRIQTGSYKNKDGQTVYTTDIVVEEHEFCESKQTVETAQPSAYTTPNNDGWMNIADGIDEELPFE